MPVFADRGAGGQAQLQVVADWLASHITDESTLPGEAANVLLWLCFGP